MYLLPVEPSNQVLLCLVLIGIALSIFICAVLTSIALSVPKAGVGMAFSLITCIENLAFTLFPIYFGHVAKDRSAYAYNTCLLSMSGIAFAAIIFSSMLILYDIRTTRLLTMPENSKKVMFLRKQIDSEFLERSIRDSMVMNRSNINNIDSMSPKKVILKTVSFAL